MTDSIWPMAAITVVACAVACAAVLHHVPGVERGYRRLLWIGLGSSTAVNLLVKGPLGTALIAVSATSLPLTLRTPPIVLGLALLLAPVSEEAAKLVPLVVPRIRGRIQGRTDALWVGMALGMSFGVGEAVWVAITIAHGGDDGIPWYAYTGYATERFVVCFGHGVMTAVVLCARLARAPVRGYLAAVAIHAAANLGPFLALIGAVSSLVAGAWTAVALLALAAVFERLRRWAGPSGPQARVLLVASDDARRRR